MVQTLLSLNWVDVIIILLIAISTFISFIRGFTREALSLIAWVVAIWIALLYCHQMAAKLPSSISHAELRVVLGFSILFVGILLVGALISYLVSHLVEKTRLTLMNRLLGIVFGAARGALLIAVAILASKLTPLPQYTAWKDSVLIPEFTPVTVWIQGFLPDYINQHFPDQTKAVKETISNTSDTVNSVTKQVPKD